MHKHHILLQMFKVYRYVVYQCDSGHPGLFGRHRHNAFDYEGKEFASGGGLFFDAA